MELSAPLTASAGQPGEASLSALQERSARRAPCEGEPPAGPLRQGEPPIARSSPRSSHARLFAATVMMSLQWREETTLWTTPTCRSNPLPRWPRPHSTTAP
jgi:hypothetical protein